ncbi:hypothetical protein CHGG_07227 [Chaetomium globosum CBS 148.51]|uniref:Amino acid permease/ SLC12A domain-containing protein n=1 Tax=Chaetomium globosum (strain ATCC 6205 / CBS 148.51 / DSM 1962 / NBRC 6347 / NRRL 1970) TaxID=306901 RepID=Q2GXS7_CHAGB|nr:uncharacterized protein CHGG_07227 [Chaetomium globosum CBS 148.51]EAQ85974.1 hypothetical protein CHGG_07227 [Chaetomium globosum CBS 148.51]
MEPESLTKRHKLGVVSGVYIPVCLNILSILMFLRFGLILGQVGLLGILGLMLIAYTVDFVTTLSLSAIASNGEVKGGGAYYLISRSLGPEFGGSIGVLFYLAQVLNTALNVVGLIDCIKLNLGETMPDGYWWDYFFGTMALVVCTGLCLAGSAIFSKASNALLIVLTISTLSIPLSALVKPAFSDPDRGIEFTGASLATLRSNLLPHSGSTEFKGFETFRDLFGILFPATSGIFAGASMSGDLRNPSKAIPAGTLWAMLSTFIVYLLVILALASSTTHASFLLNANIIQDTNIWPPIVFAGELATTFFSALMGVIGSAKLMQALARDKLFPGLSVFGKGTKKADEPIIAIFLTYVAAQMAMFANLNQIATLISMGYQMTFFVMNLACFLLKIGSAPNFRPGFKFFSWQTAFVGSLLSAAAMFFIDETYATTAVCLLVFLFLLIHYLSPPKHWGDVSQNLIYHQVRKYLLRLKPEHIKFWRPQIILLINNPRRQTRLIQFCNSLKKGALYILGHVIVTDDFAAGVTEAKLQQSAWTKYISEYSRIKAFVQLTMSPTITWGVRNLVLSAGLGGMRPNIAIMGFYNMDDLRRAQPASQIPEAPVSPVPPQQGDSQAGPKIRRRRRGDTSSRILEGILPTDSIKNEDMMSVTSYLTILEDLALRYRLNVAIGKGFETLETPRKDGSNTKKYIDLWPIQMSAAITADGKNVLTTNFDTSWKKAYNMRVIVFVEYESEVEEERGRVKALLDKLRIDAEVLVFYLASGSLSTYETVIHGHFTNPETENLVNECLKKEEWWEDLQTYRGSRSMTEAQEFASIAQVMGSTSGRPGLYNPHSGPSDGINRRRHSLAQLPELPKKPSMSQLNKWGVNMGIHTQNLPFSVFDSSDSDLVPDSDSDSDSSETDAQFADVESASGEDASRRPLLTTVRRRRSFTDVFARAKSPRREKRLKGSQSPMQGSYGTMPDTVLEPSRHNRKGSASSQTPRGILKPERPTLSRHGSSAPRFSSNLVPQTTITNEDGTGPRIMFAETEARTERPALSRQSSYGRGTGAETGSGTTTPVDKRVSFAELAPGAKSPAISRRSSISKGSDSGGDTSLNIPGLLASYQLSEDDSKNGSSYSTQGLSLSFNDLPSRAQHLILNELMRQHSSDTAVMLTTLPIPQENTCQSEEASLAYLSDVEVLCNGLPPVLLVLSNHMTVTPTSTTRRTPSLSQRLRELGRLKSKTDEKAEREFEVIHTPDRPTRLITPIEAPTEVECGNAITRWQHASAKERLIPPSRGQYWEAYMDDSAIATDSDDDEDALDRLYGGKFVYGQGVGRGGCSQQPGLQHTHPPEPAPPRRDGPLRKEPGTDQSYVPSFFHGIVTASPAPAPLFSDSVWSPSRTSQPRSPNAIRGNPVSAPRYTGGECVQEDEKLTVDMEQLVRMEIYRRGRCPYCRNFFPGGSLPLTCPYLDCQKDFSLYLEYTNRREAPKAPPRLAQRALVDTSAQEKEDIERVGQGCRPIVPNFRAETGTPPKDPKDPKDPKEQRRLLRHHTPQRPSPLSQNRRNSSTFLVEVSALTEHEKEPLRHHGSRETHTPTQQRRQSSTFRVEVSTPMEELQEPPRHYMPQRPPPPLERSQNPAFPIGILSPQGQQQEPLRHYAPRTSPQSLQQRQRDPSPSNTIRTIWPSHMGIYDEAQPSRQATSRPDGPERLEKPLPPPPARSERRPPPTSFRTQPRRITTPRPQSITARPGLARPGLARPGPPSARPESVSTRRESISAESILSRPGSITSPPEPISPRPDPISARPEPISARPRSISTRRQSTSRPESFAAQSQSNSAESISTRPGSISALPEPTPAEPVSNRARSTSRRPEPISARRRSFSTHPESVSTRRQSASRPGSVSAESVSNRPKSVTARPWSASSQSIPSRPGSGSARPASITTRHQQLYSPQSQSQSQSQQPKTSYLRTRRNSSVPPVQPLTSPVTSGNVSGKPSPSPTPPVSVLRYRSRERGRATDPVGSRGTDWGGRTDRGRSRDTDRLRDLDRSQTMNTSRAGYFDRDGGALLSDRDGGGALLSDRDGGAPLIAKHREDPGPEPEPEPPRGRSTDPTLTSRERLDARLHEKMEAQLAASKNSKRRRRRSTHGDRLDDADILAWKGPAGRARYQRETIKAGGDDAELFMDIIGQYDDDEVLDLLFM